MKIVIDDWLVDLKEEEE